MSYFDERCGTCRHHRFDPWDEEWVCENPASDCYGCVTEYGDVCEDYEERC